MTHPRLQVLIKVKFEERSKRAERAEVLADLEDVFYAVLETGQNENSGDGAFYNLVESFSISVVNRDTVLKIDIDFETGTFADDIEELIEDFDTVLYHTVTGDTSSPERECYKQVLTYNIKTNVSLM